MYGTTAFSCANKTNTHSHLAILVACVLSLAVAEAGAVDLQTRHKFDIPAQPLDTALLAFSNQAKVQVLLWASKQRDAKSPGVTGELTALAALQSILSNTGLSYREIDEETVAIVVGNSDSESIADKGTVTPGGMRLVQGDGSGNSETRSASTAQESNARGMENVQGSPKEPEYKIQEIVVTAQKREERLIDVPMSITSKSGDELAARGITDILDLSYVVPGLSVFEGGPAHQLISIRGISSSRGNTPLTGVYLDEMPLSGLQDGNFPAYPDLRVVDLERVEVLKGPQGTLYGEGAAGGLIRFITKDPDLSGAGGDLSAELSNTTKGGWSEAVTGVLNLPLASNVFGIRVAAKYENLAGWIDQPSIGRKDINDNEIKHARIKALYAPTENFRIKGMVEIHRNDFGAMNVVNQTPVKNSNFLQAFDPSFPTDGFNDHDMFNLEVAYDFPFAQLLSSTSYAKMDSRQTFGEVAYAPGQPIPWLEGLVRDTGHDASIAAQELRLTSVGSGPFRWTTGGNYKQPKLITDSGGGTGASLLGGAIRLPVLGADNASARRQKNWAVFADGSYQFANHFEVGGGVRHSSYTSESWVVKLAGAEVSPRAIRSITSSKPTYRGYIKYAFSADANVYLNVGTGFRSGGQNNAVAVAQGAPSEILPENTLSYELGMKAALLDHRLQFTGAVFYSDYRDMITDRFEFINGNFVAYTANGQDAEVKGVEAEIDWAATDRLTLSLAGDVTHTEITKLDPLEPSPQYVVGDMINFVPKYSVSAGADYRFQWSGSVPGYFQLTFNRKGEQSNSERSVNILVVRQMFSSELNFLNASLGAEWSGWNWTFFGRNLLDEDNLISPNVWGWPPQARPRTFGVMIGKSF